MRIFILVLKPHPQSILRGVVFSFVAFEPPKVSVPVDLHTYESDFSFEEKENVFSSGRMASRDLPLSQTDVTHRQM